MPNYIISSSTFLPLAGLSVRPHIPATSGKFDSNESTQSGSSSESSNKNSKQLSRGSSGSWERHPFLNLIRSAWTKLIRAVTPESIETLRKVGPYAILLYLILSVFGIKKIHQDPRSRVIYSKVAHFARTRHAKLFATGSGIATATTAAVLFYILKKIGEEPQHPPGAKLDKRPFLAFGGGFFLYPFYWGVISYLRDNFDLSDVRCSGLSAGLYSASFLLFDVSPVQVMEMVKYLFHRFSDDYGALLMIESEVAADAAASEMTILGFPETELQSASAQNRFYTGVSEVAWIKIFGFPVIPYLKHRVFKLPSTIKELARSVVATCTIFPLLGTPLCLRPGKWAIDGALSSAYAIPDDQDLSKVVRITPFTAIPYDITMPFMPWFHCWNMLFPPDAKRASELFETGYRVARSHHEMFLEKGFTPLDRPERRGLSKYKKQFEQMAVLATKTKSLTRKPSSTPHLPEQKQFTRVRSPSPGLKKLRDPNDPGGPLARKHKSFMGFDGKVLFSIRTDHEIKFKLLQIELKES